MVKKNIIPLGNEIFSVKDLGLAIKAKRKKLGYDQKSAAALCNVGTRFFSELENGKPTLHIDKVIGVLENLGFKLSLVDKEKP